MYANSHASNSAIERQAVINSQRAEIERLNIELAKASQSVLFLAQARYDAQSRFGTLGVYRSKEGALTAVFEYLTEDDPESSLVSEVDDRQPGFTIFGDGTYDFGYVREVELQD